MPSTALQFCALDPLLVDHTIQILADPVYIMQAMQLQVSNVVHVLLC